MKTINNIFQQLVAEVPQDIKTEVDMSFAISDRIFALMHAQGLSKKQFADALGRKPSEITKWLSGQHNFTIRTIAMLTDYFGQPIIQTVPSTYDKLDDQHTTMVADDNEDFYTTE